MFLTLLTEEIRKHGEGDIALVRKAYNFAREIHKEQKRVSGEDYIIHLENTALTLAELGLDEKTIVAGLLHDSIEDEKTTLEDIKKEFGEEVAFLVNGVTKISKIKISDYNENQAESIRKMLLSASEDIRIILVKLADRLDNMNSLDCFNEEKQKRIAKETMDIYVPLAYRLGLSKIKSELEDLSFKILNPGIYYGIKNKLAKKKKARESYLNGIKGIIEEKLKDNFKNIEIESRSKYFYSIYKKMLAKNSSFDEIYDKLALRIITESVGDCYTILGIIHSLWKPIPKEFDDYIANPNQIYIRVYILLLLGPEKS